MPPVGTTVWFTPDVDMKSSAPERVCVEHVGLAAELAVRIDLQVDKTVGLFLDGFGGFDDAQHAWMVRGKGGPVTQAIFGRLGKRPCGRKRR